MNHSVIFLIRIFMYGVCPLICWCYSESSPHFIYMSQKQTINRTLAIFTFHIIVFTVSGETHNNIHSTEKWHVYRINTTYTGVMSPHQTFLAVALGGPVWTFSCVAVSPCILRGPKNKNVTHRHIIAPILAKSVWLGGAKFRE